MSVWCMLTTAVMTGLKILNGFHILGKLDVLIYHIGC